MVEQVLGTSLDLATHLIEGPFPLLAHEVPLFHELMSRACALLREKEPGGPKGSEHDSGHWKNPSWHTAPPFLGPTQEDALGMPNGRPALGRAGVGSAERRKEVNLANKLQLDLLKILLCVLHTPEHRP